MKKILITGANSYIGTSFEKYIAQFGDKYQVDTLDMIGDDWKKFDFWGYDTVYHVAGIAHSDNGKISKEKAKLYYEVNTKLTIRTAMKAKKAGVKQFIFMSSAIVYGDSAPIGKMKMITRDTPASPANCYGDSKVKAEKGLRRLEDDRFKVVILRPPMIYGMGSKGNYPLMSKLAQKMPVFPYVKNCRSMLYIENLCEFVRLMIENEESGTFWPQNSEYSNTSELVHMIGETHGKNVHLIKGFEWTLKFLGVFTGIVDKAFGNLAYTQSLSKYKEDYRVADLKKSIALTEGISDSKKSDPKKALMLTSVASMIDQFNIPNIELLQSLGYRVDVIANFEDPGTISFERAEELKQKLVSMGVKVTHVAIPRILDPKSIISAYRSVKKTINKDKYDLIHCHSPIGGAICRLAAIKARRNGTKVIYTAHGFHFYDGAPMKNWLIYYPVEKFCSRFTDVLITINKEDYKRACSEFNALKTVYIPGIGINIDKFANVHVDRSAKRSELGITDSDIMILSVGELNENKNHSTVIKAIGRINDKRIHYYIAGKGNLDQYLKDIAERNNVDLHLLGFRPDVEELYKCADIYVLPSIREGLNVSLMEAMASGLPCVASRIRGNCDLICSGKGGFLCRPTNIEEYVNKITTLIANDHIRKTMGEYNHSAVVDYSQEKVNSLIYSIYKNIHG